MQKTIKPKIKIIMKKYLSGFFSLTIGMCLISFLYLVLVKCNTDLNRDPDGTDLTNDFIIFGFMLFIISLAFTLSTHFFIKALKSA